VLPGAAYTEKDGIYVNTEGRVQEARRALFAPGQAKEDWSILRMLADGLGKKLPYASRTELLARLAKEFPHFAELDAVVPAAWNAKAAKAGTVTAEKFDYPVRNFYMTDPISRASKTMAQCSELAVRHIQGKKAA